MARRAEGVRDPHGGVGGRVRIALVVLDRDDMARGDHAEVDLEGAMAEDLTLENVLGSKLDVKAPRFGANREALRVLMAALQVEEDVIWLGGGVKVAEA